MAGANIGLSPRVRGNRAGFGSRRISGRSIPACAGEPLVPPLYPPPRRVYPRVCGGTAGRLVTVPVDEGLSPRVRGNRWKRKLAEGRNGSIPACAGEPGASPQTIPIPGVYPRVCGGTTDNARQVRLRTGLSPRVRGNHEPLRSGNIDCGSIPACAGEPQRPFTKAVTARVYPRVCGGTLFSLPKALKLWGLSPRVRGNLSSSSRS